MSERNVVGTDGWTRSYRVGQAAMLRKAIDAGIKLPAAVVRQVETLEQVEEYFTRAKALANERREEIRRINTEGARLNAQTAAKTDPEAFTPITPTHSVDEINAFFEAYRAAARAELAQLNYVLRDEATQVFKALDEFWADAVEFTPQDNWKVSTLKEKEAGVAEAKTTALELQRYMLKHTGVDNDIRKEAEKADRIVDVWALQAERDRAAMEREKARTRNGKVRLGNDWVTPEEKRAHREAVARSSKHRRRNLGVEQEVKAS